MIYHKHFNTSELRLQIFKEIRIYIQTSADLNGAEGCHTSKLRNAALGPLVLKFIEKYIVAQSRLILFLSEQELHSNEYQDLSREEADEGFYATVNSEYINPV